MIKPPRFSEEELAFVQSRFSGADMADVVPRITALVEQLIARVADKWSMQVLEILADEGEQRFTRLSERIPGISQKMPLRTARLQGGLGATGGLMDQGGVEEAGGTMIV